MHLCDLSSDAPDPAQSSVVRYTKVVTQNMKVFPKCQINLCWKHYALCEEQMYGWQTALRQTTSCICYQRPRHVWDL